MVRRGFTVALAGVALMVGGLGIAIAGQAGGGTGNQIRDSRVSKFDRTSRTPAGKAAEVSQPVAAKAAPVAERGAPSSSPSQATPSASPVAVATVAETPAAGRTPLGLSKDAPSTAPAVGGGGQGSSSPSPAATPEPTTLLLMGAGLAGLYGIRRRRR